MTILGDISQGVYAHRGISDWSEIRAVFQSQPHYEEITQNYRSTYQIVAFTNEVLKRVRRGKKVILADPFSRFGERPTIVEVANREKMFAVLAEDIKLLKSENVNNIAIIVKTTSECQSVVDSLKKYSISVTDIIANRNTEFRYSGGIVVLPAALAKGIEFEAALVVNADAKNYVGTVEYDGRLLYVAVTRALHYLNVYFVGTISPFLELAKVKAAWRSKAQQMVWQKQFTVQQLKKRNGKIDPNEDKMLEEDLTRMLIAQKERTERNMPRRDFDGSFVSPPLRDDYTEDSSAEYNEYNWWD